VSFENPLIETWRAGGTTSGFWLMSGDPYIAQQAAASGPDLVLIDTQHGLIDERSMTAQVGSVRLGGSVPVVRVSRNDFTVIGRALDVGAFGVVVPMVNDAAEAAAAVAACKFPPHGIRSYGPARVFIPSYDPAELNKVACIVMIETARGIQQAEAIISTPGVDAVLIGPADLALALGLAPDVPSERHAATIERIRAACAARHVPIGMVTDSGAEAREWADRGFQLVFHASDTGLIGRVAPAELRVARGQPRS